MTTHIFLPFAKTFKAAAFATAAITTALLSACSSDTSQTEYATIFTRRIEPPSGMRIKNIPNAFSAVADGDSVWVSASLTDGRNPKLALFKISQDLSKQETVILPIDVTNDAHIAVLDRLSDGTFAFIVDENAQSTGIYTYNQNAQTKQLRPLRPRQPASIQAFGKDLIITKADAPQKGHGPSAGKATIEIVSEDGKIIASREFPYTAAAESLDQVYLSHATILENGNIAVWQTHAFLPDGKKRSVFAQKFEGKLIILTPKLETVAESDTVDGRCLGIVQPDGEKILAALDAGAVIGGAQIRIAEFDKENKTLKTLAQKREDGANTILSEFFAMGGNAYLFYSTIFIGGKNGTYLAFLPDNRLETRTLNLHGSNLVVNTAHEDGHAFIFSMQSRLMGGTGLSVTKVTPQEQDDGE